MNRINKGEIVTPLKRLPEGEAHHVPVGEEHILITDAHSVADVLRWMIYETDYEEVRTLIDMMEQHDEASNQND